MGINFCTYPLAQMYWLFKYFVVAYFWHLEDQLLRVVSWNSSLLTLLSTVWNLPDRYCSNLSFSTFFNLFILNFSLLMNMLLSFVLFLNLNIYVFWLVSLLKFIVIIILLGLISITQFCVFFIIIFVFYFFIPHCIR